VWEGRSIILKCRIFSGWLSLLQGREILIEYRQATLLRIALANSIGFSASTAVPIWVGSVGAHFGFPSWGAGALATGQLACAALLNAATPWLFPRAHLRRLAFVAAAVALLGNGLAWLGSSSVFIAGCLLCGAGFGVLLNVTNRLVAGSSAPQRGYAVVQLVEVLFCIGFFLGVPPIVERFGILSVFAALAALCAAVFLLLAGVPVSAPGGSEVIAPEDAPVSTQGRVFKLKRSGAPPNTGAAVLSLCATALLFAGQSSVNASLVSIGAAVGLSVVWVGRVISLGLLASLSGAIIARGLGERAGVLLPLLAGAGVLGTDMLVVTLVGGAATFIGAAIILFMRTVFLLPYIYALLAELDKAGRWASIAPGFVLTGWALGPGIAGVVSHGVDFTTLGYAALACIAAAMILFLCAQRLR
jgi:hypothetical protein